MIIVFRSHNSSNFFSSNYYSVVLKSELMIIIIILHKIIEATDINSLWKYYISHKIIMYILLNALRN